MILGSRRSGNARARHPRDHSVLMASWACVVAECPPCRRTGFGSTMPRGPGVYERIPVSGDADVLRSEHARFVGWSVLFCFSIVSAQSPPMVPTPLQTTPADASQQTIRQARSAIFDNRFAGGGPPMESQSALAPGPVTSIPSRDAQELPASSSTEILPGTISGILACESNNHRAIYTETTLQIEQVLSDENNIAVAGGSAAVVQAGGSIMLPNGTSDQPRCSWSGSSISKRWTLRFFPGLGTAGRVLQKSRKRGPWLTEKRMQCRPAISVAFRTEHRNTTEWLGAIV
jgi:hypothetical protein